MTQAAIASSACPGSQKRKPYDGAFVRPRRSYSPVSKFVQQPQADAAIRRRLACDLREVIIGLAVAFTPSFPRACTWAAFAAGHNPPGLPVVSAMGRERRQHPHERTARCKTSAPETCKSRRQPSPFLEQFANPVHQASHLLLFLSLGLPREPGTRVLFKRGDGCFRRGCLFSLHHLHQFL